MDYQRNKKYFTQESKTWPIIAAFALILIGFIMAIILSGTRGMNRGLMMTLGLVFMGAGAVIAIIYTTIRIKDSEIDACLPAADAKFLTDFTEKFTETNAAKLRYAHTYGGVSADKFEPVTFSTYSFDVPEALHKRGSDGKSRSSIYALSAFMLKPGTICLAEREISLISTEQPRPDRFSERAYAELGGATLVDPQNIAYSGITKYKHLRITDGDGSVIAEFPILADAAADEYAAEIDSRIKRAREHSAN